MTYKYDIKNKRIFVAGHKGMVGSALVRRLGSEDCEVITAPRAELDLLNQEKVRAYLKAKTPDCVIVAAAYVGGILANSSYPVDFLYRNLQIQNNLIEGAHEAGINNLLFLGSSCIYPKFAEQPIQEDALLTGPLEPTNEWYAIAKIAGIKLCDAYRKQYGRQYISAMPTNLYGPFDNFNLESSHVLPALIRKAHAAKAAQAPDMTIWGTGAPLREFMHVDDLADGLVFLLQHYNGAGPINVGTGSEISILDLAALINDVVGFEGELLRDLDKPDGTPRKLMDSSKLRALGWSSSIDLKKGVEQTYQWFLENQDIYKS
jgi:GDP-L-fucose synthase